MGIWDELQSSASRLFHRKASAKRPSDDASSIRGQLPTASIGVTKVSSDRVNFTGTHKSEECISDPHRREKFGRILSNLGKFAVDSAVNESLKGVTGGVQVYKLVKDGLPNQAVPRPSNGIKKQDLMIAMDEIQAKMEKMQEEVNILKQQNQISAVYSDDLDPLKDCCDEPIKTSSSSSSETNKKKFFIRSRL